MRRPVVRLARLSRAAGAPASGRGRAIGEVSRWGPAARRFSRATSRRCRPGVRACGLPPSTSFHRGRTCARDTPPGRPSSSRSRTSTGSCAARQSGSVATPRRPTSARRDPGVRPAVCYRRSRRRYGCRFDSLVCWSASLCLAAFRDTWRTRQATAERHFLYVAEPGIRNYVEYGGIGVLVFDMDAGLPVRAPDPDVRRRPREGAGQRQGHRRTRRLRPACMSRRSSASPPSTWRPTR